MFEKTFAEAFRAGEVSLENLHDYIEYWHTHEIEESLREFLGMTKSEYVAWVKSMDEALYDILDAPRPKIEIPVCAICGTRMGVETAVGVIAKSNYIGTDICHDCQVDHCLATNCMACTMGKYPDCKHIDLKRHYLEEARQEREKASEEGEGNAS